MSDDVEGRAFITGFIDTYRMAQDGVLKIVIDVATEAEMRKFHAIFPLAKGCEVAVARLHPDLMRGLPK